jgi:uncharacterized protein YceK
MAGTLYARGKNPFFQESVMRYLVMMLAALALLGGCQKKDDPGEAGPAERAGRKLDQATEQAGQKLDNSVQRASDKLNEASKEAGRKLEEAGKKIESAAEEREAKK